MFFFTDESRQEEIKRWERQFVTDCQICNGTGFKIKNANSILCDCKRKSEYYAAMVESGIPRKFLKSQWNWQNFHNAPEALDKAKSYVDDFDSKFESGQGLYLYGELGVGKTYLSSLIARQVVPKVNPITKRRYTVAFYLLEELMQWIRQSQSDLNLRIQLDKKVIYADCLIIDNLGSETGLNNESGYVPRTFEFMLRKRNMDCLPTIISSNLHPNEVKNFYSESIETLIQETMEAIHVHGANFRKVNSQTLDISKLIPGGFDNL